MHSIHTPKTNFESYHDAEASRCPTTWTPTLLFRGPSSSTSSTDCQVPVVSLP